MTINDKIRDEKLQYDINREAAKISALSSGKIHKYEYLTGADISLSSQQHIIEKAKFTYSPLEKTFEKQLKTIEYQGEKQFEALENLKSKEQKVITDKSDDDESLKQKKTYNKLFDEEFSEIQELSKETYDKNLIYNFTTKVVQ